MPRLAPAQFSCSSLQHFMVFVACVWLFFIKYSTTALGSQ